MSRPLLTPAQMASFVARGFLRFDAVVPQEINDQFMAEAGQTAAAEESKGALNALRKTLAASQLPETPAGTPLAKAYPEGSAVQKLLNLPVVAGALESLLGDDPVFDHHFLHVTFPAAYYEGGKAEHVSQHTHQDSTVDPRTAFDVQLMYYPHAVTRPMGGTRFIPGTHLRKVSEYALARYQNVRGQQHMVCEAGTFLLLHHGMWHGGGVNLSDRTRYMFKIRMHASGSQVRRYAVEPREEKGQRPIFLLKGAPDPDSVETHLMTPEPWFEADTGRLEYINRIKLWRYVSGDPDYDADYWMTRLQDRSRINAPA